MHIGISHMLLWLVALIQGAIIVALVFQLSELRRQVQSGHSLASLLPLGSKAPAFLARQLESGLTVSSHELVGHRTMLCFVTAGCHSCRQLISGLSRISPHQLPGLVVFCNDAESECKAVLASLAMKVPVLLMDADDIPAMFNVASYPVAVDIDEQWHIAGYRYVTTVDDLLDFGKNESIGKRPLPQEQTLIHAVDGHNVS